MSANPKGAAKAAPARTRESQREEANEMTVPILGADGCVDAAGSVRG